MDSIDRKDDLIKKIAVALRGREGARPATVRLPKKILGHDERIFLFRKHFEAQGGDFFAGPSIEQIIPSIGEALRVAGVTALFSASGDIGARLVAETLVPFGPFTLISPEDVRGQSPPVSAGLQTAEFAIAETGTIVQTGRGGKTLLPGLLSDVHVALLSDSMFVDRMDDCIAAISGDVPRNISFITGPSCTGDIEQTLTAGVHGPKKVIAVVLP